MEEEVNDKALKRQRIIDEDRFKQQMGALKGIATALNKPQDNGIADAIKGHPSVIKEAFRDAIKELKAPEVKVEMNTKEYVTLVEKIMDKAVERIEASNEKLATTFENRPMVDEFEISNLGGGRHKAKVIYKKAAEITIKK